jgi:hypothetical protein
MSLVVLPVLFDENGKPRDQKLADAVEGWATAEFGREYKLSQSERTWAIVDIDAASNAFSVKGIGSIRSIPDVTFHVSGAREAVKLYDRMRDFLSDNGLSQQETLVYVEPKEEEVWRGFFKAKGAVPANRWILVPGTGVEDVLRKRTEGRPPEHADE